MNHKIFFIVGESGSGKDSLANEVCTRLNLKKLLSYTTRPQRQNEDNTHTFILQEDFYKYEQDIIAFTQIGEYIYFSTKQQLYDSDIYLVDYKGIEYIQDNFKNLDIDYVTIFINTPDLIRENRVLNNRGDDQLKFYKRCFDEKEQFDEMMIKRNFNYAISNINFTTASNILEAIIISELQN